MPEQIAVVTGASSGIGEEFARELARRGFSLVLVARRKDRLTALKEELNSVSVDVLCADLATEDGVAMVARRLLLGGLSLLVNNAGLGYRGPVIGQTDASVTQILRVNLEAPVRLSRAAAIPMVAARRGAIINVVSMSAFQPVPHLNVYAASKAGLLSFTEALADELSGDGVRVQALCPGNIPTGFQTVAGTKGSLFDRTASMSARRVAVRSLDALLGGRAALQIPGGADRLGVLAQRVLPRFVPRRIAGRLFRPD
jgi:short-subunit dehydrogenase